VREIRTLRAMWRVLETEPRQFLTGHEEGNLGYMPRRSLRVTAPVPDPTSGIGLRFLGYMAMKIKPISANWILANHRRAMPHWKAAT